MKIAIVYDPIYPWVKGGGEKALWELSVSLVKRGHEVHYFGMRYWDGPDPIERLGVHIHGVCAAVPLYSKSGLRSKTEPLVFAAGLLRAFWKIRPGQFDVIDCVSFPYTSVFVLALLRALGVVRAKIAITWLEVWGRDYWRRYLNGGFWARVATRVEIACGRLGDRHICISDLTRQRLADLLGVPVEHSATIPFGIHVGEHSASPDAKSKGACVIASRLIGHKNVHIFVEAWPLVLRQCPSATAMIIGDGPCREELRRLIEVLGIGESIVLAGWLERAEMIRELSRAEILVHPSTREGQGLVALEAMAMGTVVVAARHHENAIASLLRDGENGLLVARSESPDAWADAIISLLRDPVGRERIAANARQTAREHDWDGDIVDRYLDCLERLCAA